MEHDKRELLGQLFRLAGLLRRRDYTNPRGVRSPALSPHQGQGRVLALLKLKPEVSQKELSTILDIRSQSLGELLAKLEHQGYITRTPSEEDRRVMNISLTEAGKAALEKQNKEADVDSFLDCLESAEQEKLGEYLERLIARLEEEIAANGGGDDPHADLRESFPGLRPPRWISRLRTGAAAGTGGRPHDRR